jgi:hypothetical protein
MKRGRMFTMVGALVLVLAFGLGGCMTVLPTVEMSGNPTSGYAPLTVKFDATTTCANTIVWSFGDGGTSSEESPTHIYQNVGTYTATVTVTNSGMSGTETASDSMTITVGEKPFVRISSVTVDTNPACVGETVGVSAVIEHNRPITCQWTADGVTSTSTDTSSSFSFGSTGSKVINLTVTDDAGTKAYGTATVTVKECCDDPCDDPCDSCDPCESVVLDRLEPERACVSAYEEFEIVVLFKEWPCIDSGCDDCESLDSKGIIPCPCPEPDPDCNSCNKKVSWNFAHNCCGGDSPVLGEDYEIMDVWGEFGQYIRVKFFLAGEWTVTASINGEEVTGRYEVVVQ